MRIIVKFALSRVEAELFDTPTGRAVYEALPLHRNVNRWGEEIYFEVPVHCELEENARAQVNVGDLAYWPNMPAFCIFFGPTPLSTSDQPVAASPVNVFGRILALDTDLLSGIPDDANVVVERAG
ncbi:MAG: hypothetical protein E4H10_01160 [Bacteroidia bacterium]|nr:MAG: hypothetical protein E4H10_01160 [Bacteroidia bacterium]